MKRREFILKRIIDVVEQTAPNSEVYLYGSRARGTARKMSDWDLLILLNSQEITFDFETRVMDDFYEIEIETGEVFSPMIFTKADWNTNHVLTPLFANIKREGVRLK